MSPADYGPNGGAAFDDLMLQLMEAHQPQASPTSRATLSGLPRRKVRPAGAVSEGFSNTPSDQPAACACGEPCSVCHDGMEEGLEVVELPCQHCYHEDCITAWLKDVSVLVMVMASVFSVVASPILCTCSTIHTTAVARVLVVLTIYKTYPARLLVKFLQTGCELQQAAKESCHESCHVSHVSHVRVVSETCHAYMLGQVLTH